jgi:Arc/MetJ family transcription regulator
MDWEHIMRTSIVVDIDDQLLEDALRATGLKTRRESWNWVCGQYCGSTGRRRYCSSEERRIGRET